MARTDAGAVLTAQHRRAQVQLRARALRDYTQLWPLWQGDDASFGRLVDAALPLVRAHHRISSSLAAAYYPVFRTAERVGAEATPRPAGPINQERVVAALHVTGRVTTGKAILAGQSPQAAMQTALVRTSGTVTRHVLQGGRDTLVLSSGEDRQAQGWARVTSGTPCAFCAMVASRGAAFAGADTAEFQAHDHCACMAEPAYEGSAPPGRASEFRELWDKHAAGENPFQSFRRALEAA